MTPTSQARAAVAAFEQLQMLRQSGQLALTAPMLVELPGDEGAALRLLPPEQGLGVELIVGDEAYACALARETEPVPSRVDFSEWDEAVHGARSMPREVLPSSALQLAQDGGARGPELPCFYRRDVLGQYYSLHDENLSRLVRVVRALCRAASRSLLDVPGEGVLRLRVAGSVQKPIARVDRVPAPRVQHFVDEPCFNEPVPPPPEAAQWPRRAGCLEVAFPQLPFEAFRGEDELRALAVLDPDTRELLAFELVLDFDLEAAMAALWRRLGGEGKTPAIGLPERIECASRGLAGLLPSECERLGVGAVGSPVSEAMREAVDRYVEMLLRGEIEDPAAMPAIGDHENWLDASSALDETINYFFEVEGLPVVEAWQLYYDAPPRDEADVQQRLPTYRDWYVLRYVPEGRDKTPAAMLLEQELAPAQRRILRSLVASTASIFRVDGFGEDRVELFDLLSSETVIATDRSLSRSVEVGELLPLRLNDLGGHVLVSVLGPQLLPNVIGYVFEQLELRCNLQPGKGIAPEDEVGLGFLWDLLDSQSQSPPQLQNTSGDPLRLSSLLFEVEAGFDLDAALASIPDLVADEDQEWTWLRPARPGEAASTVFAVLRRFADELIVEVNSEERAALVRDLLAPIAGLRYVSEREIPFDPTAPDELPLDDRLPSGEPSFVDSLAPGELDKLRSQLEEQLYIGGLDEPVPMFDNLTPRQAAQDPRYRERVRRWIETYPESGGDLGLRVPRERMKKEIGLE